MFCYTLEDQFRFVLKCIKYKDLRKQYIAKYLWGRPNVLMFIELLSSDRKSTIHKLGCFCRKGFQIKNLLLGHLDIVNGLHDTHTDL